MKDHKTIYLVYSRGIFHDDNDYLIAIYDNEESAKEHIEKESRPEDDEISIAFAGGSLEIEEHCLYTKYKENK